ncbi:hypothetical protein C8F01DRAFT_594701 [Mycena amicta]|nr:hypothetical protein C8F01DRAFT_594701 [Mycena amicta]
MCPPSARLTTASIKGLDTDWALHHRHFPMSDTLTSAAVLSSRRRRAMIACTNCRRRKIKCVTTEEPPRHPCERCTKRDLPCEYVAVVEDDSKSPTPETPSSQLPPPSPGMGYGSLLPSSSSYYAPPQANLAYSNYPSGYGMQQPTSSYSYNGLPAYPTHYQQHSSQLYASMPQDPYAQGSYQQSKPRCSCRGGPCYCGARHS